MEHVKTSYINGVWRQATAQKQSVVTIRNPWNQEVVFRYAESTPEEVTSAVTAALGAVKSVISPRNRSRILERTSELLAKRSETVAQTLSAETGKPICDARLEVGRAILNFRMSSEEAARIHGYTEQQEASGGDYVLSITVKEPYGVVCAITPFNFPLNITSLKIGPALAAGNSVVLKPADATPATAALLVELFTEAGLPPGYLNLVLGGPEVGRTLVADQRIALFTFTGSVSVGEQIKSRCGIRPVILELGSNAPNIVHCDADLELAVDILVKAAFSYAGQVCVSAQRIFVHSEMYRSFLDRFVARVQQLKIGNPQDEDTDIGPMISEQAAIRVENWVREALDQGAIALTGGVRRGNLLYPTVLTGVKSEMKVMCEELFGPVVSVVPYQTVDEAIQLCNQSDFGLQAGVFTKTMDIAFSLARGLQVGSVNINQSSTARPDSMPYGGVKNSGIGKEGSRTSVDTMSMTKVITFHHQVP